MRNEDTKRVTQYPTYQVLLHQFGKLLYNAISLFEIIREWDKVQVFPAIEIVVTYRCTSVRLVIKTS